jgi:hypothetical protein
MPENGSQERPRADAREDLGSNCARRCCRSQEIRTGSQVSGALNRQTRLRIQEPVRS